MEIVLLEDVKALGKKGQIVKVNDGYARNFILPKKLGVEATAKNLNDLKLQKANAAKVAAEQLAAAKELAEKIESGQVVLKMKAGEGGKAFGSVSGKELPLRHQSSWVWISIRRSWFCRIRLKPFETMRCR